MKNSPLNIETMNDLLIFGWVAANIQSNFAAWCTDPKTGFKQQADMYHSETADEMEQSGLTWFCIPYLDAHVSPLA